MMAVACWLPRFAAWVICTALVCSVTANDANRAAPKQVVTLASLIRAQQSGACVERTAKLWQCARRIELQGLRDLDIQGEGLHVQFTNPEGGMGGIQLVNAERTHMSDFTISWRDSMLESTDAGRSPPIFSMGRVEACTEGGRLQLRVPVTGVMPVDIVSVWDEARGWPWKFGGPPSRDVYFPHGHSLALDRGATTCIKELDSVKGQAVLVRHRAMTNHAWQCVQCHDFVLQKAVVTSAPGMAYVFGGGTNLALIESKVEPACGGTCASPTPSVAADGAHFTGTHGTILIADNDFSFQGDDGINVASALLKANLDTVVLGLKKTERWITVGSEQAYLLAQFGPGTAVTAYDKDFHEIGSGLVLRRETNNRLLMQLDTALSTVLIGSQRQESDRGSIERNRIHDSRARGILLTSDNVLIADNVIERVTMNGVLLASDSVQFFEGPGARNVRVVRNKIRNSNLASSVQALHSPISVGAITPSGQTAVLGDFINVCTAGNQVELQSGDLGPTVSNAVTCDAY